MRDFLYNGLNVLRRGIVTFCAVVAMLVIYGVSTIVTQGLVLVGATTAALVSTTSTASARHRGRGYRRRGYRGRGYRGRGYRGRGYRRRGWRRRGWRGRRRRGGIYLSF